MALYKSTGEKIIIEGGYYNCQNYGVLPSNADNTSAMQALIDTIYNNGGGVIYVPCGTYKFDTTKTTANTLLIAKSNVSIIGESISGSILKLIGSTTNGKLFFGNSGTKSKPTTGCTFENMTLDSSEATIGSYNVIAKAFMFSYVKDCVWKDLRLLSFPATALGIDILSNVVIDSVYVYRGGREWKYGNPGGAGIGIGTGLWDNKNENYIIRNCICEECGHFGIFLEDQGIFASTPTQNFPSGQIIANNIVRNCRNYGIGLRGGQNVIITDNNIYENYGGIYMDYGAKNVMVSNNIVQGNKEAGFLFGNEDKIVNSAGHACENVILTGNGFYENLFGTWNITEPVNSHLTNNLYIGNSAEKPTASEIDTSLAIADVYINDNGEQAEQSGNWLYNSFIDLTTTRILCNNKFGLRIAEYDENQNFLRRWYGEYWANTIPHRVGSDCRYIKLGSNTSSTIDDTLRLYH